MKHEQLCRLLQTSLLVGLILPSLGRVTAPVVASPADDVDRAVVKIIPKTNGPGSGVVVCVDGDTASIVTAAHVVGNDDIVEVSISPRADLTYQAQVMKRDLDTYNGLALIVLRGEPVRRLRTLDFDTVDPKKDDAVFTIGFPGSTGPWNHMPGRVSAKEGLIIQLSSHVEDGNSGGPVINEQSGKAVGLIMREQMGLGHAIPASTIRATLAGWGLVGCGPIEIEFGGADCESYQPRFYQNRAGIPPSWVSNGAELVGTSEGKSTAVESYYVCSYNLPHPVRNVTLTFLGGSVDFSAPEGTGGGFGLLVYAGEPDMDLRTWGNHGTPKYERWWSKQEGEPTKRIVAEPEGRSIGLGDSTNRVSVVVMLGDAWASQTVKVQIRGIRIKLE